MPSASARSSAGKQLEICQYCQRVYRGEVIPFHLCWFCGASPAWHHGRRCRLAPWGPIHREHVEAPDTIDDVKAKKAKIQDKEGTHPRPAALDPRGQAVAQEQERPAPADPPVPRRRKLEEVLSAAAAAFGWRQQLLLCQRRLR